MRNSTLKICVMLLAFCTSIIHLQAMDEWYGATAKGFYSGTGTKVDPYRIFTASQFLYFLQQTKDGNTFSGQYIELCNDIAFKSNIGLVEGGDFYGDFNGNDHIIQVNEYWTSVYYWYGWTLFNLYGSMHDVQFINANEMMKIYTGGILYNCRFEYPSGKYHGWWTIYLEGGTIANCVSNSAHFQNKYEQGGATGFVSGYNYGQLGYCSNCYFPIESYSYGNTLASNYCGVVESCGEEAGNDWVLSHTERAYKSWPFTFSPTYPEYLIEEQPNSYNPSVIYPHSDNALYQWYYQKRKPITFEGVTSSSSTQTMNFVVPDDDVVLSFDFTTHGYVSGRYDDNYHYAWVTVNGEEIVHVYNERVGTYSCPVSAGTYEISCEYSDIINIRITYPTEILVNETSNVLSKQTIMGKPGAYFCQVSYGEGCDVMYSDYVDYEKLLTIDNVTYVINEDATATVLWVADMAVNITIPETVYYDDVNYPVTSISSKAFVDCTSLACIKCKTSNVPTLLGGTTFEGLTGVFIPSNITLYVPVGSESAYSAAEGWREFGVILGMEMDVELVDGQSFDNNENKVVGDITYTRTFNNTNWQALYVPFAMNYADWAEEFDVAKINDIHQFDEDGDDVLETTKMEIVKVKSGTLKANHPYMIRAKSTGEKTITVENATLMAAEANTIDCSSVELKYTFTGTYKTVDGETMVNNNYYAMSGGGLKPTTNTNASLKPFRWYMQITDREGQVVQDVSEVKVVVRGEDDWDATGIDEIETTGNTFVIHGIDGRMVRKVNANTLGEATEGLTSGMYVINGKKHIVK